jgi:hypothetical protein
MRAFVRIHLFPTNIFKHFHCMHARLASTGSDGSYFLRLIEPCGVKQPCNVIIQSTGSTDHSEDHGHIEGQSL